MRVLIFLVGLMACAGAPDPVGSVDAPEPQPREAATSKPVASSTESPTAPEEATVHAVRIVPLGVAMAEDGVGGRVSSETSVAIDIETEGWPGQAMEPSLEVGELRFAAYSHVSPTVLRFVATRVELLPAGDTGIVRYGDREVLRFVIPEDEVGP